LKKLLLLVAVLATGLVLVSCGGSEKTLTIFQNKIEIDEVLRTYAEAWGEENGVNVEVKSCGGDACQYGTQILAEFQSDEEPDIFVIEGLGGYNIYADEILEFSGQAWQDDTINEFVVDGKTYGFPVALEGWGMAYNEDLLLELGFTAAEIAALEDNTQAEFKTFLEDVQAAFDADSKYENYTPVSMAASSGMTWVTGLHNFNGYLAAGMDYTDRAVIEDLLEGTVDAARLTQLADWVEILFDFSDQSILTTGGYDEQVGKFASGEAAFLHQGNWTDGSYDESDFAMGYVPHATMATGNDSIFVAAPSYYVINKDSDTIDEANQFLNDLALTQAGHEYMVNEANMVPAFESVTLTPSTPLSAAVLEWTQAGKIYPWFQNDMPSGFGQDTLGPIYELFANGTITKADFITQVTNAIEDLAE
jgi:raffinose/stachyose/melibiose transport system substrate-binding protein